MKQPLQGAEPGTKCQGARLDTTLTITLRCCRQDARPVRKPAGKMPHSVSKSTWWVHWGPLAYTGTIFSTVPAQTEIPSQTPGPPQPSQSLLLVTWSATVSSVHLPVLPVRGRPSSPLICSFEFSFYIPPAALPGRRISVTDSGVTGGQRGPVALPW